MQRRIGRLVRCQEGQLGGRVFLIENGRRHWLTSAEHVRQYGFTWPDDVEIETETAIKTFKPAGPAPLFWSEDDWLNPPRTSIGVMREIATSRLFGTGVEFGAGTMPVAIPLDCRVHFADAFSQSQLTERAYAAQGKDFVDLNYVTGLEEMQGVGSESLDFVIAAHVIEHLRNPLLALRRAYEKLRPGGSLVLFVPDKQLTFDKAREVTPLQHLIADYENPSDVRDLLHYVEFYSKAFVTPIEQIYERVRDAVQTGGDVHFHTWTYESFQEMIAYCRQSLSPWSDVWSQPAVQQDKDANEFYFVLTK